MNNSIPTLHRIGRPPRVRIRALARAIVFDREAVRTLQTRRSRVVPIRPAVDSPVLALTPWDMMDEEVSDRGITFSRFQRHSAASHATV